MATHTPGPWRVEDFRDSPHSRIQPAAGMAPGGSLADVYGNGANARLIAAAPTMYQELELAADTFRDFSNVLRAIGKDTMSAAAEIAERHIREYLVTIEQAEGR